MTDARPRALALALGLVGLFVVACGTPTTPSSASWQARWRPIPPLAPRPARRPRPSPPHHCPKPLGMARCSSPRAWATAPLTDVASGEEFRIADLAGKVVILETMAIWCPSCRAQQGDVQEALARLPPDRVEYVVLDVDPSEDAASLAEYAAANGFKGRYAIAGTDVARALAADFGDQFLNPPSTPMLVIGGDGTVTPTDFGHKSVDEVVALAEAGGA